MEEWRLLAGNIYLWLFVSALFAGAAFNSLVSSVYELLKKDGLWSRHMPAFYIFLSLAAGILAVSVFFVDWASVVWASEVFFFFFGFTALWLLIFRFLFPWGMAAVVVMVGVVLFLNFTVSKWQNVDIHPDIAVVRLLSVSDELCEYEITAYGEKTVFRTFPEGKGSVGFYSLVLSPVLFFVPGKNFVFLLSEDRAAPLFFGVLEFVADKTECAELETVNYRLPFMLLLREYVLSFNGNSGRFIFRLIR